jgi:hypothetical protein
MHKVNLIWYVIGVAIVWAVILCAAWLFDGGAHLKTLALVCGGFAIGMLAMYIAVHVYKWK